MAQRGPVAVAVGAGGLVLASAAALWALLRRARVAVHGDSMAPALADGDRALLWPARHPRPGDVVALADPRQPGRTLVKRVVWARGGEVWVEGDNRASSTDSRHFGPVPARSVQGRLFYRYFPSGAAGRVAAVAPGRGGPERGGKAGQVAAGSGPGTALQPGRRHH